MPVNSRSHGPQPLVEIRLYSHLRRKYGKSYRMAVSSAAEAVRALSSELSGFRQHLIEHAGPGYRVWYGDAQAMDPKELHYPCGKMVRIVPVIAGSKNPGLGAIFIGAALIGLAFAFPGVAPFLGTSLSQIGTNIGISQVLEAYSGPIAAYPVYSVRLSE